MSNWNIEYTERGEGRLVVFVNGLYQSALSWQPVADALASDYRVVTFDFPNQWSAPDDDRACTPQAFCECILELTAGLGALTEEVAFVGLSFGAELLLRVALEYGRRCGALLLINPPPLGYGEYIRQIYELELEVLKSCGAFGLMAMIAPRSFSPEFLDANPGLLGGVMKIFTNRYGDKPEAMRVLLSAAAPWQIPDAALSQPIDGPVFVYESEREMHLPPRALETLARRLGAPLIPIAGGHTTPVEQPELTESVLREALAQVWPQQRRAVR